MPVAPDGKWYTFVPKGSKSKAIYNTDGKGMKTDSTYQLPDDKAPGCNWNYPVRVKSGTTLLVRLTGIVESKRADACLAITVRWQDGKRRPIEWETLGGTALTPAKNGEEVVAALEIDVPDGKGVEYVIIGMGYYNAWPGVITYKKLEFATIEKK